MLVVPFGLDLILAESGSRLISGHVVVGSSCCCLTPASLESFEWSMLACRRSFYVEREREWERSKPSDFSIKESEERERPSSQRGREREREAREVLFPLLRRERERERERERKKEREKEREIVFRNCEEYQEKHWNYVILTKLSSETQVHFRLKILAHKNINTFKWNQGQGERFLRKVRLPSGGDPGSARLMKNHTFSENKLIQSLT